MESSDLPDDDAVVPESYELPEPQEYDEEIVFYYASQDKKEESLATNEQPDCSQSGASEDEEGTFSAAKRLRSTSSQDGKD